MSAITRGLILFGHGARDPEWAGPLREVQRRLQAKLPTARVELAFLEFQMPDLEGSVQALISQGCHEITVLPMFMAPGGHLKRDLPVLMAHFRERHPQVRFELAAAVGTADPVLAAMAEHAAGLLQA